MARKKRGEKKTSPGCFSRFWRPSKSAYYSVDSFRFNFGAGESSSVKFEARLSVALSSLASTRDSVAMVLNGKIKKSKGKGA